VWTIAASNSEVSTICPSPVPVLERRQNAHAGENSRRDVGDRGANLDGRSARPFAGDAHEAAHALRYQTGAGALGVRLGAPEAEDRAVDQSRVLPAQLRVAETQALHHAAAVAFKQLYYQNP